MTEEIPWQEVFYNERYNVAIPWSKNLCKWVIVNVPDFSQVFGIKRRFVNILFLIIYFYILGGFMITAMQDPATFFVKITLISFVAGAFYSKMVAMASLQGIETYQKIAKKVLNRS